MSSSILVMAPDGLLEFDAADIADVSIDETGTHVLLKTGQALLLVGHEASQILDAFADKLRSAFALVRD